MKASEFRKLIKEEIRKVLKEAKGLELTLQQFADKFAWSPATKNAIITGVPKYIGDINDIVVIGAAENEELFDKIDQYYDQPEFAKSFKRASTDVDPKNTGYFYWSKLGKAFHFSTTNEYYIISKSTLQKILTGAAI